MMNELYIHIVITDYKNTKLMGKMMSFSHSKLCYIQ